MDAFALWLDQVYLNGIKSLRARPVAWSVGGMALSLGIGVVGLSMATSAENQVLRREELMFARRIPRIRREQDMATRQADERIAAIQQMLAELPTKTRAEKLDDALDALYSFSTLRPSPTTIQREKEAAERRAAKEAERRGGGAAELH